jgi:alcohol dehydrogenase YqhD (iron-dependent ADH family)
VLAELPARHLQALVADGLRAAIVRAAQQAVNNLLTSGVDADREAAHGPAR